ncbi:MAG TPA: type II TA system antitoxin MqsA family protein [Terracidiphilus sp.]|nr:type II TA system antitoxin MqsA family protein [Terracidiphilus sp.]
MNMPTRVTSCPECCKGDLIVRPVKQTGTRNGEDFQVIVTGVECDYCGYQTILNSQSGEFTRAVSDAYRREHGLLVGDEIRDLRIRLDMNQVEFAEYLGVGSASVKRWESGQIQDRAMDNLIRLKAQPDEARHNYRDLEARLPSHCGSTVVVFVDEDVELSTCSEMKFSVSKPDWNIGILDTDETDELLKELVAA